MPVTERYRFKLRRGTAAEWAAENEILMAGEAGYSTDTGAIKIGDGITPWLDLPGVESGLLLAGLLDVDSDPRPDNSVLVWSASAGRYEHRALPVGLPADLGILHCQDRKASGANGGASSGSTWHTRTLNTIVLNTIAGASLSADQFTLPAGTYDIHASAPCHQAESNQVAIYSVTDAATLLLGQSQRSRQTSSTDGTTTSIVRGRLVLANTKTLTLRHYIQVASATGLGSGTNSGQNNVFAELFVKRVA